MYDFIGYSVENGVARVTFMRPEVRNAQNRGMLVELMEVTEELKADDRVKVVVLAGDGASFSAGHDMGTPVAKEEWGQGAGRHPSYDTHGGSLAGVENRYLQEWEFFFESANKLRNLNKVTIAQVQGHVIAGGLMLMWACDLIYAADGTKFFDPVAPAMGMCGVEYFSHPWELGTRKAKELLLLGAAIDASEAAQLGMVNQVVAPDQLEATVSEVAATIAELPLVTSMLIKNAVNQSADIAGYTNSLKSAFHLHQLNHAHWAEVTKGQSIVKPRE